MQPEDLTLDDEAETEAPVEPADELTIKRRKASRKRSITIFIVVSLLNVGLLALLWSQLLTPAANQSQNSGNVSRSSDTSGPLIGKPAPDFALAALNGQPGTSIHLASLKGKPVVLNVWQSSCVPCQHEASLLQSTWQQVKPRGVVLIGIDFQDNRDSALRFLQEHGITYTNVVDSDGSVSINYGVTGTPETIFIDRRGMIVSKHIGELTAQTLQSNLQLLQS